GKARQPVETANVRVEPASTDDRPQVCITGHSTGGKEFRLRFASSRGKQLSERLIEELAFHWLEVGEAYEAGATTKAADSAGRLMPRKKCWNLVAHVFEHGVFLTSLGNGGFGTSLLPFDLPLSEATAAYVNDLGGENGSHKLRAADLVSDARDAAQQKRKIA